MKLLTRRSAIWRHRQQNPSPRQQRQGLRAKAAKKFKATTNYLPVAPSLLQQDFTTAAPNRK